MSPVPNQRPSTVEEIATLHAALQTQAAQIIHLAQDLTNRSDAATASSARRDEAVATLIAEVKGLISEVQEQRAEIKAQRKEIEEFKSVAKQLEGASKMGKAIIAIIMALATILATFTFGLKQ